MDIRERVERDFSTHEMTHQDSLGADRLRAKAKDLAHAILDETPPGREQSSALTRLEEVVFHAVAGIARGGE